MRGIWGPLPECQGVMKVWSRDVVPGETGRGASFESRRVVYEVGDDHLYDLWKEPMWLGGVRGGIRIPVFEHVLEFGFGTVPDRVREAFYSCGI